MQFDPLEKRIVDDFRARLSEALGGHLVDLRLFGSRARGTARRDSDLDVVVVVDERDRAIKRTIYHISDDVNEAHDWQILLSPLVLSRGELEEMRLREMRLARDIDREGIAV